MNRMMQITKDAINRHGLNCTYIVVTEGIYDINSGSVTNTETSYTVKCYKKHIKANQYNFPNLIDKDLCMIYLCSDGLNFIPSVQDFVIFKGIKYKIDSIQSHDAYGETVLYKLIGVKQWELVVTLLLF